jgi:carboxyl-terminal processing protease
LESAPASATTTSAGAAAALEPDPPTSGTDVAALQLASLSSCYIPAYPVSREPAASIGGTVKITVMVLTLALLVGASQAQETVPLPCAQRGAFDAALEPTMLRDERQRRQLIDEALERVQRLHVDPGFDGVDLDELRQAYESRIVSARYDHEVVALVKEMLAWVNAYFISREERERERAERERLASFSGVGISISFLSDGHVLGINYVFPGSPAEAAGLARGDRIIGVDQLSGCPHPNDIRGPAGTDVTLTVRSPGQPPRRIAITRAPVEPNVLPRAHRLDEVGIGYLWPGNLSAPGHPESILAALDDIGAFDPTDPLDGLVLDLRSVFGGDTQALDSMRNLAGFFTEGTLLHVIGRSERRSIDAAAHLVRLDGVALVILVDAATGDFLGMLPASLQERKRAQVVGEPVRGAWRLGIFQDLPDGSNVNVPFGEIELLDGTRPRLSGLVPDSVMTTDWRDHPEHDDPYIAEAIRLIRTGGIGTD